MESASVPQPQAVPENLADQESREQRVRELVSSYQLLVCNPSPAYAAILNSNLRKRDDDTIPMLLGICATAAEALALIPPDADEVLLVTTSHLRDGSCVQLVETLLSQTAPPHLLVVQVVDAPALPLASLRPAASRLKRRWRRQGHSPIGSWRCWRSWLQDSATVRSPNGSWWPRSRPVTTSNAYCGSSR